MNTLIEVLEFYCIVIFPILIIGHSILFILTSFNKKLLSRINRELRYQNIEKKLILLFGIGYILGFTILTIFRLNNMAESGIPYSERIFGAYAYAYWTYPLIYLVITILRQIEARWKLVALSIFSFLVLIQMEAVVITISMSQDYLPGNTYQNYLWFMWLKIFRNYSICLLLYVITIETMYRIQRTSVNRAQESDIV